MKAFRHFTLLIARPLRALLVLACVAAPTARAAEKAAEEPTKPKIEKLDESRYRVSDVILDKRTREKTKSTMMYGQS